MTITAWHHSGDGAVVKKLEADELRKFSTAEGGLLWVDLSHPTEEELAGLAPIFNLHPLAVEDCIHAQEIPKIQEYENTVFVVLHGLKLRPINEENPFDSADLILAELDLFIGENFLITVHTEQLPSIEDTRAVFSRSPNGKHVNSAQLAHRILDELVDNYTPVLEVIDEHLEYLENELEHSTDIELKGFLDLHRSILKLRRISLKQQEVFFKLSHRELAFIPKRETLFFADINDHMVRIVHQCESFREILLGIQSTHMSMMSNRMNDVMRVLTIFTAILMPLTLITGVYGMNFQHMPELYSTNGYYVVLACMGVLALGMVSIFKLKKWL